MDELERLGPVTGGPSLFTFLPFPPTDRRPVVARTLDEKLALMQGDLPFWEGLLDILDDGYGDHPWTAGPVRFADGPRGVVIRGATTFPVSMARAATWDIALEERVGEVMGKELRALGGNLFGGVCVNLLRHPGWGRAQETYGEDPLHVGELGAALTRGVQRHAMACVKHFALNSMENARFKVDVRVEERALREVYLSQFKRVVDEGVACVMSAYNSVNGEWCGQNRRLLTEILKDDWGFEGFVMTDFIFGLRDAKKAVLAGLDLEMPFQMQFRTHLEKLVERGEVPEERIEDAGRRILDTHRRFVDDEEHYDPDVVGCAEHRALSREVAQKSIVLLKNDAVLPLDDVDTLAVIGPLASVSNTGDGGSSDTRPDYVVTPLEGIRAAAEDIQILHDDGSDLDRAAAVAAEADAAIVVVGLTRQDEGEFVSPDTFKQVWRLLPVPRLRELPAVAKLVYRGLLNSEMGGFYPAGDRRDLSLGDGDETLIQTVAAANRRTAVTVMGGSAITMERWRHQVGAILMLWYPGMEGGHALAELVFGEVNPSGRLPLTIPKSEDHLPEFDPDARTVEYDLWHGYRKLQRDRHAPAFPFGFGLSYTRFDYRKIRATRTDGSTAVTVTVANTGERDGAEVVQIYASMPGSTVERPPSWLVGFARVELAPGESRDVSLEISDDRLACWDEGEDAFVVEPGEYTLWSGRDVDDPQVETVIPIE